MEKHQNKILWALIISQTSHVFCCVLPALFGVLSLLSGLGLVSAMPAGFEAFHAVLHEWEALMLGVSGVVLVLGWWIYFYSRKIDCHDSGCHHGPCGPGKMKANTLLKIATVVFIINTAVYGVFHDSGNVRITDYISLQDQKDDQNL